MSRKFQWTALLGGGFLVAVGLRKLYYEGDWVLLLLSFLIIAFTLSAMSKSKP